MRPALVLAATVALLAGVAAGAPRGNAAAPAAGRAVAVGVIDSGIGAGGAGGHGSGAGGHGGEVAAVLRGAAAARGVRVHLVSLADVNRSGAGQPRLMAREIRRAAAAGLRVVNISQTIRGRAGRVRRALAAAPDTLFVVAAGNEGLDLAEPDLERDPCSAPQPNVICVGELRPGGARAANSNHGNGIVDAWAPGPGGTSFAAPRVAAHAAALLRRHPTWSTRRLRVALVVGRGGRAEPGKGRSA
ncbi:MAG TPA: S8 family serine peptidase [Solirubrobacterales bacterium]|nr:S8 family serine peptidase [Solirubrobacterales bacterium]